MILYEVLNERPDALAERTYAVWPDLAAPDARERRPASSPSTGTAPSRDFDLLGVSFATELGYTNLLEALDLAGVPLHAVDRDETPPGRRRRRARRLQPRAGRRLRRLRRPRRRRAGRRRHHRRRQGVEGRRAAPAAARSCSPGWPGSTASTCRASTPCPTAPDGAIAAVTRTRDDVPAQGRQAHRHGPRRVALPEDAAGAAGRERARADERRDLPRLHPRLPLLPGRDDHPPGARADHHRHRLDGRRRASRRPATRRSACSASPAPTTPRSASWPRSSPTATRAPTPA